LNVTETTLTSTDINGLTDIVDSVSPGSQYKIYKLSIASETDYYLVDFNSLFGGSLYVSLVITTADGICYNYDQNEVQSSYTFSFGPVPFTIQTSYIDFFNCGFIGDIYIWVYPSEYDTCANVVYYGLDVQAGSLETSDYPVLSLNAPTQGTLTDGDSIIYSLQQPTTGSVTQAFYVEVRDVTGGKIEATYLGDCPINLFSNWYPTGYTVYCGADQLEDYAYLEILTTPGSSNIYPLGDISYTVTANWIPFTVLNSTTPISKTFSPYDNDVFAHFYTLQNITANQSISFSLSVTRGRHVNVVISSCSIDYEITFECYEGYDSCDLISPYEYYVPAGTDLYIVVSGADADYTIELDVGSGNCVSIGKLFDTGANKVYGGNNLGFCEQVLTGANVFSNLQPWSADASAWQLFEQLYTYFDCPSSQEGLCDCIAPTRQCNSTLQQYACAQFFEVCSPTGIETAVCADLCDTVSDRCGLSFVDVGLVELECRSNEYTPNKTQCSGCTYDDCGVCNPIYYNACKSPISAAHSTQASILAVLLLAFVTVSL